MPGVLILASRPSPTCSEPPVPRIAQQRAQPRLPPSGQLHEGKSLNRDNCSFLKATSGHVCLVQVKQHYEISNMNLMNQLSHMDVCALFHVEKQHTSNGQTIHSNELLHKSVAMCVGDPYPIHRNQPGSHALKNNICDNSPRAARN